MTFSSNVIFTKDRLAEEISYFRKQDKFIFDVETTGKYRGVPQANQVVWMSLATYGRCVVVPMGHPNGNRMVEKSRRRKDPITNKFVVHPPVWDEAPKQLRPSQAFDVMHDLFFDPNIEKGGHGDLFDFLSVAKYFGGELPVGPYHDNILMTWLLNENQRLGLKDVTKKRYKREYDAEHVGRKVEIHPFNKVAQYAYLDGKYTWMEFLDNLEEIEAQGLTGVYNLERDVFKVLLDIGMEGQPVDREEMERLDVVLSKRRVEAEAAVYKAAGKRLNLNSPKQKVDTLYGKKEDGGQGLKPWRLTKGGLTKQKAGKEIGVYDYSTDAEALERFAGNPVVDALMEYQEVDRVLGTYVKGYLGDPDDPKKPGQIFDGKVYPEFVQYGTVTGRFSCRTPNLQNIPRPDTELGKAIRGLFIAGEDHKLVVADYGQVELVVLAHFVGRGALYEGFHAGVDPHTMTAAMVFGQDPHDLTLRISQKDAEAMKWRQIAKNLNFAIVYGAGPDKVASMSKVNVRKAKEFLATHERQFPEIYKFKDEALKVCKSRKPPHLATLAGRKRRLPAIMSRDFSTKGKAERQAINSLIQGSAADLIKVAMVRTHESLTENNAGKLLLTVHDELVCRTHESQAHTTEVLLREAMVGSGIQEMVDVPLSIDLKIVDKWSEAK